MSESFFKDPINVAGRKIGTGQPVYIIAELSANHRQDYNCAVDMIHAAKEAGADAVKLQTYTADTLTIPSRKKPFQIEGGTLWDGKTLHELYQEAYTPWEWQPKLKELADKLEIHLFSSPFDSTAVDFLEKMNVPVHKIASFEIGDIPLIQKVAKTGKPVIMSTGLATLEEVSDAVEAMRASGNSQLILLKCTSAYPAPPEEMNLRGIGALQKKFNLPIGLSDHTLGIETSCAAVALGACVLERHITLSRKIPTADSAFSLEPAELGELVRSVRNIEKSLGKAEHAFGSAEQRSRRFKRSLFAVKNIQKGERFTEMNMRSIRPGDGLAPKHYFEILGKTAAADIEEGTPLSWELIQ